MSIGDRIKEARESSNKTLLDVANHLGVTEATVQRYESGNIKNLKLDTISKIASYLNVNPSYLMGWQETKENITSKFQYAYYPTTISAGLPIEVNSITSNDIEKISIPNAVMGKWAGSKDIYITRVNGESMNQVIPDQSLIAVKPMDVSELKDGDIVIYNYDNEYAVKRFFRQNDKVIFRPDSNDLSFTDLVIDNNELDLKIKGKVVLYIVELD